MDQPHPALSERVLYEDNHLVIVNKMPSEIVQGDKTGDSPLSDLVKTYIRDKYRKPGAAFLGVAHRIDRPVSGVVVFARTSKALGRLNHMLKERQIDKRYYAVVRAEPPADQGTLTHYLKKNEAQNKSYVVPPDSKGAKKAVLQYRVVARSDHYILLDIELLTGRHHQVRVQLANIGCPIKGDLKYGYGRSNHDGSIHLHARSVAFLHPVRKEPLHIVAPFPAGDPLWMFFDRMQSV